MDIHVPLRATWASLAFVLALMPANAYAEPAKGDSLHLATDRLAAPLIIPGDRLERQITSVVIHGELPTERDTKASVIFDMTKLLFNEFGDAFETGKKKSETLAVVLHRLPRTRHDSDTRNLYELVFEDDQFSKQLTLAIATASGAPHRLIVRANLAASPVAILDLHGLPAIKDMLPDRPLKSSIHLTTLYPVTGPKIHRFTVGGELGKEGRLEFDGNHFGFSPYGDIHSSTLMAFLPKKVTLRPIQIEDPSKKQRRIFEAVADQPGKSRYFVVLSPTDAGPHRLIVRTNDKTEQVLQLYDPNRRDHQLMQRELAKTPIEERNAINELRAELGYGFQVKVEAAHVVELRLYGRGDVSRLNGSLAALKNLRHLELNSFHFDAAGLACLRGLTSLQSISLTHMEIDDRGLACFESLANLKRLHCYVCGGITDRGMEHLANLKDLTFLRLYREDTLLKPDLKVPTVTNDGLKYLKNLTKLEYLQIFGQNITDDGLANLQSLANLKSLGLSGKGITDEGLKHLQRLSKLESVDLGHTSVTPAGLAALKAKLPKLKGTR